MYNMYNSCNKSRPPCPTRLLLCLYAARNSPSSLPPSLPPSFSLSPSPAADSVAAAVAAAAAQERPAPSPTRPLPPSILYII